MTEFGRDPPRSGVPSLSPRIGSWAPSTPARTPLETRASTPQAGLGRTEHGWPGSAGRDPPSQYL